MPEEIVPLEMVGKMVLDRNPDNFFAETEQVAFCPSHIVPGIDFSEDPLLQRRLFSYLDTQLSRLGSSNFHEIPINRPKCPFANLQRDGHMQMLVPKGRANYEPNSIDPPGPREIARGLRTAPIAVEGMKVCLRAESFADHYSQARLFYRSVTPQEQRHIANALTFDLGKVDIVDIRRRILGHLDIIAALRQICADAQRQKSGRAACRGVDSKLRDALVAAIQKEGATAAIIAPKVGGIEDGAGTKQPAAMALAGSPSVLFDAVAVLAGPEGDKALTKDPDAVSFLMDACRHLKAIALAGATGLAEKTQVSGLAGVFKLDGSKDIPAFLNSAREGRVWARETE